MKNLFFFSTNNPRDCHLLTMPSSYLCSVTLPKPQPPSPLFPEHSVVPSIHNAFFSTGLHRSCYYQSGIRDRKRERVRREREGCVVRYSMVVWQSSGPMNDSFPLLFLAVFSLGRAQGGVS